MRVAGIICEYNPMHLGHMRHIEETRRIVGGDSLIVCVMSGNFVQRGDYAIFAKHPRAEAAVRCGVDLVIELPLPYVLSSSEGFAKAGVYLLSELGADFISFGSECGDIVQLSRAAEIVMSQEVNGYIRNWLDKGYSYGLSCQKAVEAVLGVGAEIFKRPNNLLGIEYIKAIISQGIKIQPVTIHRSGGEHDGDSGYSSSAIRRLINDTAIWHYMPEEACIVYKREMDNGFGPVFQKDGETAMLSRLRAATQDQFEALAGASEGLYRRVMRFVRTEPTIAAIAEKSKTKRYALSRIRRMLMCACLGVTASDSYFPPPYIRVLAMNESGMLLLRRAKSDASIPVITKPASQRLLSERAASLFKKEAAATDFYTLAYPLVKNRVGGQEWIISPSVIRSDSI